MKNHSKLKACMLCMLSVTVVAGYIPAAPAARSNDAIFAERIAVLERISDAQAKLLQQLQQQLNDTQRDLDRLRGEVQENGYRFNRLSEEQKRSASATTSDNHPLEGVVNNQGSHPTTPVQGADANRDYNEAVMLILEKKQYDQAIQKLQTWVKKYPDSTFQPNANYWLGQLNYNQGNKDSAAHYFAVVVKKFPDSPKRAEALFKIGIIMQDKNELAKAQAVYQQVIELYPTTETATQAKKRLDILTSKK